MNRIQFINNGSSPIVPKIKNKRSSYKNELKGRILQLKSEIIRLKEENTTLQRIKEELEKELDK